MFYSGIERKIESILKQIQINSPPINLDYILEHFGLKLEQYDFGERGSGVLYIKKGEGIIGINLNEKNERKRFTIAHELGHFLLHKKNKDQLFVEEYIYRDQDSESGEFKREREANAFAAALLMPKIFLKRMIKKNELDVTHEDSIDFLAKKFQVSEIAMTYRVTNLKLI